VACINRRRIGGSSNRRNHRPRTSTPSTRASARRTGRQIAAEIAFQAEEEKEREGKRIGVGVFSPWVTHLQPLVGQTGVVEVEA